MDEKEKEEAENKCGLALSLTRAQIRQRAPYVSRVLYNLVPHFEHGFNTLAVTDRLVLIIDPVWFVRLDSKQQAGVVMHEIFHILRDMKRIAAMPDRDLANTAFDIPINEDLRAGGWELPAWVCYPETYDLPKGLSGEQYYELLKKKLSSKDKTLCKALEEGLQVGNGKCGGCAGNSADVLQEKKTNDEMGRTTNDIQYVRRATAEDIRQFANSPSGRGKVPRTLLEHLPESDERMVLISWKAELANVLRRTTGRVQSGRSDFSYRRPSRRSFMYGMIKPGMISHQPVVAFVEDTSASMGRAQLQESRIQAVDVMTQLGLQRAWWISSDARVSAPPQMLSLKEIRKLPVIGRGGTDFRPAIALAETLRPRPDILIYNTDGDGTAPEFPPPRMEVIFCIIPSYYNRAPADWATTIILQDRLVPAA